MRKKDPKIIRVGDIVDVVVPNIFVRCGYPLSFDAALKEVKLLYGDSIRTFMNDIDDLRKHKSLLKDYNTRLVIDDDNKTYLKIARALTYDYLNIKGFGGFDRKIYTERRDHIAERRLLVENTRFVKTGTYVSAGTYGDHDKYTSSSYLSNVKTHKILGVTDVTIQMPEDRTFEFLPYNDDSISNWWDYEIEANNVKKFMG